MLLGRNHGYAYYEADCFGMFVNPFVNINVNEPTLEMMKQKPLKVIQKLKNNILYRHDRFSSFDNSLYLA